MPPAASIGKNWKASGKDCEQSPLLGDCKPLREYSWFVEEVRKNQETMELMPAADKAIEDMPEDRVICTGL